MPVIAETRLNDQLVAYLDESGQHDLVDGAWVTRPLTADEAAQVAQAAFPAAPSLDARIANVENDVAVLDSIIVAVLT